MEKTNEFFVRNLVRLRERANMNQEDVAEAIGVNSRNYQKYEYGKSFPRPAKLKKLADLFNVSVSELLSDPFSKQANSDDKASMLSLILSRLPALNNSELRTMIDVLDSFSLDPLADMDEDEMIPRRRGRGAG